MIRTGGGIYYDRFQGNRVFDLVRNPPLGIQPQLYYGYAKDINPHRRCYLRLTSMPPTRP
ncbi:MAG: hypothetical protein WDO73_28485 [Ignavibacteriota bacterium]